MPDPGIEKGERAGAMGSNDETDWYTRHWRLILLVIWCAAAALFLYDRWNAIQWFSLSDTDDNLRMMQVRALLAGQDWYDLRQYRLDPPFGANVHWSRIVDLPIAGIMLALKPFMSGAMAEKVAVSLAPMLPMIVAFGGVAVAARRLISPKAFALAVALLLCGHSARGMWMPLRIDHHGWQLAMLAVAMAALVDPKRARGGLLLGAASAVSLSIGLEMLLYLAVVGAAVALMWVRDADEGRRLATYGASLAGGCAAGYLLFASNDNRQPVCDALSPVWLSVMVAAGAIAVLLALLPLKTRLLRFGAAAAGGILLAAAYAIAWPHCLERLEGVSPELHRMWLGNVREALPVYRHDWQTIAAVVSLPIMGLIGYATMLWRERGDHDRLTRWAAVAAPALVAAALLLWQSRAGPAAQMLAVPGATALAWLLIHLVRRRSEMLVRVFGTVGAFALVSGLIPQYATRLIPEPSNKRVKAVNQANARCPTLAALRPIARMPKAYILTFVDLNPRLITVTHHDGVAGPYHRNQQAILDVMKTFRGSAENAREIVYRKGVDYVLICPGLSESTVYSADAPKGFYVQLANGRVPDWLEPVQLPKDSPFKMWRVSPLAESSR